MEISKPEPGSSRRICEAEAGGGGVGGGEIQEGERPSSQLGGKAPGNHGKAAGTAWRGAYSGVEFIRHVSFTPHNPFLMTDLRTDLFDQRWFYLSTATNDRCKCQNA